MGDLRSGGRPRELAGSAEVTGASVAPTRTPPSRPSGRPLPPRPSATGVATSADAPPSRPAAVRPSAGKPRPDPGPLRIALGLTGMAAASALVSAFLGPTVGADAGTAAGAGATGPAPVAASSPAVQHVTRYVQLAPGETAPPKAVVQQAPAPKPRVVVVTTRQSGK